MRFIFLPFPGPHPQAPEADGAAAAVQAAQEPWRGHERNGAEHARGTYENEMKARWPKSSSFLITARRYYLALMVTLSSKMRFRKTLRNS